MAYPVAMPAGYSPTGLDVFNAYTNVTSASTSYTALVRLQNNVHGIGFDLFKMAPVVSNIDTGVSTVNANVLNSLNLQTVKFSNISSQVHRLDMKVAQMAPEVITQSLSFLVGCFVALAFVIAAKVRY